MERNKRNTCIAILFFIFGGIAMIQSVYAQITFHTIHHFSISYLFRFVLPHYVTCAVSFCIGILIYAGRRSLLLPILLLCQGILPFIIIGTIKIKVLSFLFMFMLPIAYDLIYTINTDAFVKPEGLRKKCSDFYFVPSIFSLVFIIIMIVELIRYDYVEIMLHSYISQIISFVFAIVIPLLLGMWLSEPYRNAVAVVPTVAEGSEDVL